MSATDRAYVVIGGERDEIDRSMASHMQVGDRYDTGFVLWVVTARTWMDDGTLLVDMTPANEPTNQPTRGE